MALPRRSSDPYKIVSNISCLSLPEESDLRVTDPESMMTAIVNGADQEGRYFANPVLLAGLFWWNETDKADVELWRDRLVETGEIKILPVGKSEYTGATVEIIQITRRQRFSRFRFRDPIPQEVRNLVYERDDWCCLACGSKENLSIDHVIPWSLGGEDVAENFQTLCRSCNSKKGATVVDFRSGKLDA